MANALNMSGWLAGTKGSHEFLLLSEGGEERGCCRNDNILWFSPVFTLTLLTFPCLFLSLSLSLKKILTQLTLATTLVSPYNKSMTINWWMTLPWAGLRWEESDIYPLDKKTTPALFTAVFVKKKYLKLPVFYLPVCSFFNTNQFSCSKPWLVISSEQRLFWRGSPVLLYLSFYVSLLFVKQRPAALPVSCISVATPATRGGSWKESRILSELWKEQRDSSKREK